MSAAPVWEVPSVAPSVRPRLTLVPTGAAVRSSRPAALRLTRRGRATIAAALVVAAVLVGALLARGASAQTELTHAVVVPAGSSLSQIAARELPHRPLRQAVIDIQQANGLVTDEVAAGRTLVIPGR